MIHFSRIVPWWWALGHGEKSRLFGFCIYTVDQSFAVAFRDATYDNKAQSRMGKQIIFIGKMCCDG